MALYMKFGDIKGDVSEAGHKDWLLLESISLGFSRYLTSAVGAGQNREGSTPDFQDVHITRTTDKATPELMRHALAGGKGGQGAEVTIDFTTSDKDPFVYYQLKLTDVLIGSYQQSGSGGGAGNRPSDSISLNFRKFEAKFFPRDQANKQGTPVMAGYNLSTAQPI